MNDSITGQIYTRRSVYPRQFSGEIIPREKLMQSFEAANWAPTHKKTQPWRFVVFSGAGKTRLIEFWISLAKSIATEKGEIWYEANEQKFDLFRSKPSHIIAIVCNYSGSVPEIEETCATAMAVQNFWLTLQSEGAAGYWSSGNGTFKQETHAFLGLQENEKMLGYFIAGIPEMDVPPSVRKPIEDHLVWMEN